MPKKTGIGEEILSLPKGGGALQGINDSIHVDQQKGALSFFVPISVPPGRNSFNPSLSLTYSSGNGNGPFGLGWSLNIPFIVRKTSKGIPQYHDFESLKERDTFLLDGEDLVLIEEKTINSELIQAYRLKVEGLYLKIKRIRAPGKDYWKVISPDGMKNYYGFQEEQGVEYGCVYDSEKPTHIFKWMLTKTEDVFGNTIIYQYERENIENLANSPFENNHSHNQIYLSTIYYMNYKDSGNQQFFYSINFNYGKSLQENIPEYRPDPFSYYKAGFEIRTTRRCKSILIKLHRNDEVKEELIKSYNIQYLDEVKDSKKCIPNSLSLIKKIEITGHQEGKQELLPPLEFEYTEFDLTKRKFEIVNFKEDSYPERSLHDPNMVLVDIFGNGLPCILHTQGQNYRYWLNNGKGFELPKTLNVSPPQRISESGVQFADVLGKGGVDLLVTQGNKTGFYELRFDATWDNWHSYPSAPSFNLEDPNVRMFDINGDGRVDVCMTTSDSLLIFINQGKEGWSSPLVVSKNNNLENFPAVNFSDYQNRVRFADLSGSGMQNILVINQQQIDYWPNMGHGRFGKRLSMQLEPTLPHDFDPKRVFLSDIDGDGCADLIYVDQDSITVWSNQHGNAFVKKQEIHGIPPIILDSIQMVDLKGYGTPGILWSTNYELISKNNYRFLDLTAGTKPYLLNKVNNNSGALTRVFYKPSTWFYQQDKIKGMTWKTHLPFPVQCVAKVETCDFFSETKLIQEYHYHHGHWDEFEREFCGFGRVDQKDTVELHDYNLKDTDLQMPFSGINKELYSAPIEVRAWFHLGAVANRKGCPSVLNYEDEYWYEDPIYWDEAVKKNNELINSLSLNDKKEALRVLRGTMLRTEVYSLSNDPEQKIYSSRPYTVTDSIFKLAVIDEASAESIYTAQMYCQRIAQWDRSYEPQIQFKFNDQYDKYGQPEQEITIAVSRKRCQDYYQDKNATDAAYLATLMQNEFAQRDDDANEIYITNRLARSTHYQIINDGQQSLQKLIADIKNNLLQKEIIGQTRHYYDGEAYRGLPIGKIEKYGALVRSEKLILTQAILNKAYQQASNERIPPYLNLNVTDNNYNWTDEYVRDFRDSSLTGFVRNKILESDSDFAYYAITVNRQYDFQIAGASEPLGLIQSSKDELGNETNLKYDNYAFTLKEITLPKGLKTQVEYDYRTVSPQKVIDINSNQTYYHFTPLGLLRSIAKLGKSAEGDHVDYPSIIYHYNWQAFIDKKPIYVHAIYRTKHYHDIVNTGETVVADIEQERTTYPERFIQSRDYSDGFGRLLQTRAQADPQVLGDSQYGDANLLLDQNDFGKEISWQTIANRVMVSGWQHYDNKGRVVKKFEPFFAAGWEYERPTERSIFIQMQYDARGRVELTRYPNQSIQRTVYGKVLNLSKPHEFSPTPWEFYAYDSNDNAAETHAHLVKLRHYYNTPRKTELDALGRVIKVVEHTRKLITPGTWHEHKIEVNSEYDIRGNLIKIIDALNRTAFEYVYDLSNATIRITNIDAGIQRIIFNAASNLIEKHDAKGSLVLNIYDVLNRSKKTWASEQENAPVTLRIKNIYGDEINPSSFATLNANLNGQLYQCYDESGLVTFKNYDFKDNLLDKEQQVIKDEIIINSSLMFIVNWGDEMSPDILESIKYSTQYKFDALNRLINVTLPRSADQVITFGYNQAGSLKHVKLNNNWYVRDIFYNAKGQRVFIGYGNDLMTRYAYDPNTFWLTRIRTEKHHEVNGDQKYVADSLSIEDALQDTGYIYDLAGNILQMAERAKNSGIINSHDGADKLARVFLYNPHYQLMSASGKERSFDSIDQIVSPWESNFRSSSGSIQAYTENYDYDDAANLKELHHDSPSGFTRRYNLLSTTLVAAKNQLKDVEIQATTNGQTQKIEYKYDANGNIEKEQSREFTWDFNNQLRIFSDNKKGYFIYDNAGIRVKKIIANIDGSYTSFTYINNFFEHHRTVANSNSITSENDVIHIMDDVKRIAMLQINNLSSSIPTTINHYHISNHIDNSLIIVDENCNLINYEEYTPYGETCLGGIADKHYRFNSKERDDSSSLYYYGARYYAPWVGRWISPDAIISGNLYAYCLNNPQRFKDEKGNTPSEFWSNGIGRNILIGAGMTAVGVLTIAAAPVTGTAALILGLGGGLTTASGIATLAVGGASVFAMGSGQVSKESFQALNESVNMMRSLSSVGGLTGAVGGGLLTGNSEGLQLGMTIGNIAELGYGVAGVVRGTGRLLQRELDFNRLIKNVNIDYRGSATTAWDKVRKAQQIVWGYGNQSTRFRFNPLFPRGREFIEMSHMVPKSTLWNQGGLLGKELSLRPFMVRPMWGSEHALLDPSRFNLMKPAFRLQNEGYQLTGLQRSLRLVNPDLSNIGLTGLNVTVNPLVQNRQFHTHSCAASERLLPLRSKSSTLSRQGLSFVGSALIANKSSLHSSFSDFERLQQNISSKAKPQPSPYLLHGLFRIVKPARYELVKTVLIAIKKLPK